ncbi:hypothetical protein [Embleya sp. MST-111070]|uniref:hypothetical protein n=1 Tax=Embleya sp. MST-111070 TaxID=3398231 RepID=UPI003F731E20
MRNVEAVYTTMNRTTGGRVEQRAEAISDVCGIKNRVTSFLDYKGEWWTDVRCDCEVMRAYVFDGPRAENAKILAAALEAAGGRTRKAPGVTAPGTPPCPVSASSTVDDPSTTADDEPRCAFEAVLPTHAKVHAEFWDVGSSAWFPDQFGHAFAHSTGSTQGKLDVRAVTNAPRPPEAAS